MDPQGIAIVIGAVAAGIATVLAAVRPILLELRKNTAVTVQAASDAQDAANAAEAAAEVGKDTHRIVNSAREAAAAQQTRSDNALRKAGVPIPANPAATVQVTGTEDSK